MSAAENTDQKESSNQGKTKKKSGKTNKTIDTGSEDLEQISSSFPQCEKVTKKRKKKRAKEQKNESASIDKDGEKIIEHEVMIDESQDLKIGDGIRVKTENVKQPKKENRLLDVKKKEASEASSLEKVIEAIESVITDNNSRDLEADNGILVTKEGKKKKPKKKNRLRDAKKKNELETSSPEKPIDNIKCEMIDNSQILKASDISTAKENEEKPRNKKKKRNAKKKSALETFSSRKAIRDIVESINSSANDTGKVDDIKSAIFNAVPFVSFKNIGTEKNHELEPLPCRDTNKDIESINQVFGKAIFAESNVSGTNSKRKINKKKSKMSDSGIIVTEEIPNLGKSHLTDSNYQKLVQGDIQTPNEKCIREDNKSSTKQDEESQCSLSNANGKVAIQPTSKLKRSVNSDKEKEVIVETESSKIDNTDSKQAVEIENSCSASLIGKKWKKNKNKAKKEVISEVEETTSINTIKDFKNEEKKGGESLLSRQNESNLHEEIGENLKTTTDNCEISDEKGKLKKHKTNASESGLSIKADPYTNHTHFHNNILPCIEKSDDSVDFTTAPRQIPSEIIPGKVEATQSENDNDKVKENNEINLEAAISILDERAASLVLENPPINIKTATLDTDHSKSKEYDENNQTFAEESTVGTKREVNLADKHADPVVSESGSRVESILKQTSVENSNQVQNKRKKSKSKNRQHMLKAKSVSQSDYKSNEVIDQSEFKAGVEMKENIKEAPIKFSVLSNKVDEQDFKKIPTENIEKDCGEEEKSKTKKLFSVVELAPNDSNESLDSQDTLKTNLELIDKIKLAPEKSNPVVNEKRIKIQEPNHKQTKIENLEQDQMKYKKSKSKNKQFVSNVEVALIQQPKHETNDYLMDQIGLDRIDQSLSETNIDVKEIIESPPEHKTSALDENSSKVKEDCKDPVPESDFKNKMFLPTCSESIDVLENVKLSVQQNENEISKGKLENKELVNEKLDRVRKEVDNSDGITTIDSISKNNQISLVNIASVDLHCHNSFKASIPESFNNEATKDETTNMNVKNFFEIQKYDLFEISEAEKRFSKLLQSKYNNMSSSSSTTELVRIVRESEIIFSSHNNANSTDKTHINHFEDNVEKIPDDTKKTDPEMQRFDDDVSSIITSSCNGTQSNNPCTLSWSQVAGKEAKAKSEGLQAHVPENQQKNKQQLESPKPVFIRVAEKSYRADDMNIATIDSEGFIKFVSKREMHKQRSRTSSRNDEEVSEPTENKSNIQIEEPLNIDQESDPMERIMTASDDESNSGSDKHSLKPVEGNTAHFLLETGIWMEKWKKYHDAEVKFFESMRKIEKLPPSHTVSASAGDNDDDEGPSCSEQPSPTIGKRNPDKEPCGELANGTDRLAADLPSWLGDWSNYISEDEDPINLISHKDKATNTGDSNSIQHKDNSCQIETDISNDECDIIMTISHTRTTSQRIKEFIVMVFMSFLLVIMICLFIIHLA